MNPFETVERRFWSKVDKSAGPNKCWLWTAGKFKSGYGSFCVSRKNEQRAHRVSWQIAHGEIPEGKQVLHKCDVPACVNPLHLFLGTHADNMADLKKKGYKPRPRGEANTFAKLTNKQVKEIFSLRGKVSQVNLAARFKVSQSLISAIHTKQAWPHITTTWKLGNGSTIQFIDNGDDAKYKSSI